jgi:hypothetical protein
VDGRPVLYVADSSLKLSVVDLDNMNIVFNQGISYQYALLKSDPAIPNLLMIS